MEAAMEQPGDFDLRPDDAADYRLHEGEPQDVSPRVPERPLGRWFAGAALLVVLASAGYFFLTREQPQSAPAAPAASSAARPADSTQPLGAEVEPIELPPLGESDALVREMVSSLSSHPRVAAWLATPGLIRNFVVVVENIATGRPPARHLGALRPAGRFSTIDGDDEVLLDPRSYERYAPLAAAVESIDAEGAARLYSTLKPRIEEAYRELGYQESFDRALERAIVLLLQVPSLDEEVALVPKGALFAYADPRVERLNAAQKHLARMGPDHVRAVQDKLREIATALGIPAARLPPPPA
jgi:hypothetical protein